MVKVVGVKFRKPGKIYFFDSGKLDIKIGDNVIVETSLGKEYGVVAINPRGLPEEKIGKEIKCPGCEKGNNLKHNGKQCKIMDWKKNKKIKYVSLIGG